MPKITDRERLAKIEADRTKLNQEADRIRKVVRGHYAQSIGDLALETMTEREFRDVVAHAIRVGATPAIAALKALPTSPS